MAGRLRATCLIISGSVLEISAVRLNGSPARKNKSEQLKKQKLRKQKAEIMNQGRLSVEFRNRTKAFAAGAIQLFVKLPKGREEVRVLGKQLLCSGTSVAAHTREASRGRSDEEFVSKLGGCASRNG
jgi:hypothetical protein